MHGRDKKFILNFGGKLEGKSHVEDLSMGVRIILQWILKKSAEMLYTGLIWHRKEASGRLMRTH
jgi:hypothetical protein